MLAGITGEPGSLFVHVGDRSVRSNGEQGVGRGFDQRAVVRLLLGQLRLQPRLLSDVAGAGKDALHLAVAAPENRGVERNRALASRLGLQHQLIIGDHTLGKGAFHPGIGALRLGEIPLEERANEFLTAVVGHAAHLLVDVGDEAVRVHRNQAIHRRLDQAAQVGLLLAQLLLETDTIGDVAGGSEDPAHVPGGVFKYRSVKRDLQMPPGARHQGERILGDKARLKGLPDARPSVFRLGKVIGKRRAEQLSAGIAGHLAHPVVHVGDDALRVHVDEPVHRRFDQAAQVVLLLAHLLFQFLLLGDIAGRGEHALQLAVAIVEGRGVVGDHRLASRFAARGELVVGHLAFAQDLFDAFFGPPRVGKELFERRADQLVAAVSGQRLHLLVHIGDDAERVGGRQGVNIGFDQRARIAL